MNAILENYLIIIIVGLFFVFALIGYLIDMLRNTKQEKNNEIPYPLNNIEPNKIDEQNNNQIDADELLKNYEDNTGE